MLLLIAGNSRLNFNYLRPDPRYYGQLITPRRTMTKVGLPDGFVYGIDNECFTLGEGFNPFRYISALWRVSAVHGTARCVFAVAPDVVGDAIRTLARFGPWAAVIREMGFPVALAAQDGLENLAVPWPKLDALFIGGSTEWKMSEAAAALILEARQRGKWVHVGRINSHFRYDQLKAKPDSIDGTHLTKRPDIYAKRWQSINDAREMNLKFDFLHSVPKWGEK